jgi:hypothetical protein
MRKEFGNIDEASKFFNKMKIKSKINYISKELDSCINEEGMIQKFLNGYKKLALLSKSFNGQELKDLVDLAKYVNSIKGFNLSMSDNPDRIDRVCYIDAVAHNLHKQKLVDGSSIYKQLDELASISKSIGESNREDRLLLLQSPVYNINKINSLGISILQKSSLSLWGLYEKAIKIGVERLSNRELVLLREFLWSKI